MRLELERERARAVGGERDLVTANARNKELQSTVNRFEERLRDAEALVCPNTHLHFNTNILISYRPA